MEKNMRFVLVREDNHGTISMMDPCQGRYTYANRETAEYALEARLSRNSAETLRQVYGQKVLETAHVREVECWPGHNDPRRAIF